MMDDLFRLSNVVQHAIDAGHQHGLIKCTLKHDKLTFGFIKTAEDKFVIESATIMMDVDDRECRAIVVFYVDDLREIRAESLLRKFNRMLTELREAFEEISYE